MAIHLGSKLKELRKERKMTLDQLAEKADISKSYLWELENRETASPSAQILNSLAENLNVSPSYFMDDDASKPEEKHFDEAFFRGYKKLDPEDKEQLRKILETFKKNS